MRTLEARLGVMLLHRTTRHIAPTEAGQALHAQLAPAFADIASAVEHVKPFREHPAGTVRLSVPRVAAVKLLAPRFREFSGRYPDVVLDISVDNGFVDIVRQGFDAGVRLGERVQKDMVAVRISADFCDAVVATPAYLQRFGIPQTPHDLTTHRCIGWRQGSDGKPYRWEFAKDGQKLQVAVRGPLLLDDFELMQQAALDGVGLAYSELSLCQPYLQNGQLQRLLADWCTPYPGFYLYYPNRNTSAALRALSTRAGRKKKTGSMPSCTNSGLIFSMTTARGSFPDAEPSRSKHQGALSGQTHSSEPALSNNQ